MQLPEIQHQSREKAKKKCPSLSPPVPLLLLAPPNQKTGEGSPEGAALKGQLLGHGAEKEGLRWRISSTACQYFQWGSLPWGSKGHPSCCWPASVIASLTSGSVSSGNTVMLAFLLFRTQNCSTSITELKHH